jgi:hypothetical protein
MADSGDTPNGDEDGEPGESTDAVFILGGTKTAAMLIGGIRPVKGP